jgi:hypothetical protein
MVRVLVSTCLRESLPPPAAAADLSVPLAERLLVLSTAGERRATVVPAPAAGLCFAGVAYMGP